MSIKDELEKVLGLTSMATSDQPGVIAGLLAEVDALEQNVAAILAHPAVSLPAIVPVVPTPAPEAASLAPAADTSEQPTTESEAESQSAGASQPEESAS